MMYFFTDGLLDFLQQVNNIDLIGSVSIAELAKQFGMAAPTSLENSTIRAATPDDKPGVNTFIISTIPSKFGWLIPWFAKTKCVLICAEFSDGIHCLHLCITCLDSWPGPGCYIHGSWN